MPLGFKMLRRASALGAATAAIAYAPAVIAQTGTYSTTATGPVGAAQECGVAALTRTINVPDSFTVEDLNVGFLTAHPYRGDVQVDLSHGGITRRIIASSFGGGGAQANYNVLLNDSETDAIRTGSHAGGDGLIAPPYENPVRGDANLIDFAGQNSSGNWTLTMCDNWEPLDDGNFLQAHLYFTPFTEADLSLALTHAPANPAQGSNVTFTATVSNAGGLASTGRTTQINLPSGFTFVSATGGATHSGGVVSWTPGTSLASGSSESITIIATMNFTGDYSVTGEITADGQDDPDSTPGNGITGEDDDVTLTVSPSVTPPPALTCGAAATVHDWDTNAWAAGDLSNSYTTSGETITWNITGDTGSLQPNPDGSGTALPALSDYDSGGLLPTQNALLMLVDYPSRTSEILTTVDVGIAGTGVDELQFALFDVDYASGQFEDKITLTGSLDGNTVLPTLTRGPSNTVSAGVALGTAGAANDSNLGTVFVTFQSPIDQFVISYGSGTGATTPVNPGQQAISIHDVSTCERQIPDISAVKANAVYDPLGEGLYAIPGNDMIYTFTVTNSGNGPADPDSIFLIDVMPDEIEFYNGDIDDGGPETTPVSFTQTGTPALTFNYPGDVRYSDSATKPADFSGCSYTPDPGYDPDVNFICFNPKGTFEAGPPDPEFSLSFRARIK